MKVCKKLTSILLALVMALSLLPSGAAAMKKVNTYTFSVGADAVANGDFCSLWTGNMGEVVVLQDQVTLDGDHKAELTAGVDYFLIVKKNALVNFSAGFGDYHYELASIPESGVPEGCTADDLALYLFRYTASVEPEAPVTVTVGADNAPTCTLSLTDDVLESGSFLSLWKVNSKTELTAQVTLDSSSQAQLVAGQYYLLIVKADTPVGFTGNFGSYRDRYASSQVSAAIPQGYTSDQVDAWRFRYDPSGAAGTSAGVVVGGCVAGTFSLAEDAVEEGMLLGMWKVHLGQTVDLTGQMELDSNYSVSLVTGQSYLLVLKEDSPIAFSQNFRSQYGNLTAELIPADAVPNGYTADQVDVWYFTCPNLAVPQTPATVVVGAAAAGPACTLSVTEAAAFLSLWKVIIEDGGMIAPIGEVALDSSLQAQLVGEQIYYLLVKKGTLVSFSDNFGSHISMLSPSAIPSESIPQGYSVDDVDAYLFEYAGTSQAPATVTVGGATGGCTLSVTEAAAEDDAFLRLWTMSFGEQGIELGAQVTLNSSRQVRLAAGQVYLLLVKKGTPVTFSASFGDHISQTSPSSVPSAAIPQGYSVDEMDVWMFEYTGMSQAPATVTVGGEAASPGTLIVAADAMMDDAFLTLWKVEGTGSSMELTGVELDQNLQARLTAGQVYLLVVTPETQVSFSGNFSESCAKLPVNAIPPNAIPNGYTAGDVDVWLVIYYAEDGAPQTPAIVAVGTVAADCTLSLTESAVKDDALISLYMVDSANGSIEPILPMTLNSRHELLLAAGQAYFMLVEADTPVASSDNFGNRIAQLSAGQYPSAAIPSGYTADGVDAWIFEYDPGDEAPEDPVTVTVGGEAASLGKLIAAPGTIENGAFLALWKADVGQSTRLAAQVELDSSHQAQLDAGQAYLLVAKTGTPVVFSDNFGQHAGTLPAQAVPAGAIPTGYTADEVDVWIFEYDSDDVTPQTPAVVSVGSCTVRFLDGDGQQIGYDLSVPAGQCIAQAYPQTIEFYYDLLAYAAWKDSRTGKTIGSGNASVFFLPITADLTLVPQNAVAQVTIGEKTETFYSLVSAMQTVEAYYSGSPRRSVSGSEIPVIVMLDDYCAEYESCARVYDEKELPKEKAAAELAALTPKAEQRDPFTIPFAIDLNGCDVTVAEIRIDGDLTVFDNSTDGSGSLTCSLYNGPSNAAPIGKEVEVAPATIAAEIPYAMIPRALTVDRAAVFCPDGFTWNASAIAAVNGGSLTLGGKVELDAWYAEGGDEGLYEDFKLTVGKGSFLALSGAAIGTYDADVAELFAEAVEPYVKPGLAVSLGQKEVFFTDAATGTRVAKDVVLRDWTPSLAGGTVFAPQGALLTLAQYDADGRLASTQSVTVPAEADYAAAAPAELGLTLPEAGAFRLMLVDAETYAPLCKAWSGDPD